MTGLFLLFIGLVVGIVAGILGIGGGILMLPALVFLPPIQGFTPYNIQVATGISAVQSFVSSFSGVWIHYSRGAIHPSLIGSFIAGGGVGGFLGGIVSGLIPGLFLYIVFAIILGVSLFLALVPLKRAEERLNESSFSNLRFTPTGRFLTGSIVSFLAANTGTGGAILLLPILTYVMQVPTRLAIGTSACFVLVTSLTAVIGKWIMHLIPLPDVLWVSGGAFFGGALGAHLSHYLPASLLRKLILLLIFLTLLRVFFEIYTLTLVL